MRLFVAVWLDEGPRRALASAIARLRRSGGPVSWVAPENLHLTLKFLGDLPDDQLPEVAAALARAARTAPPFELEISGVTAFPARRPRIVAARALDRPATLAELAATLDGSFVGLGVPREGREFHAHVTLGRIKAAPGAALQSAVAALTDQPFGRQPVSGIRLVRSRLTPAGAVYSVLDDLPLALPARP